MLHFVREFHKPLTIEYFCNKTHMTLLNHSFGLQIYVRAIQRRVWNTPHSLHIWCMWCISNSRMITKWSWTRVCKVYWYFYGLNRKGVNVWEKQIFGTWESVYVFFTSSVSDAKELIQAMSGRDEVERKKRTLHQFMRRALENRGPDRMSRGHARSKKIGVEPWIYS